MATGNGLKLLQSVFSAATRLSKAKTLPTCAWKSAESPPAEHLQLQQLAELVSSLQAADFGWNEKRFPKAVTYEHVCGEEDSPFQLGIFLIPKHHRIPLHDHPGMLVISKLLFGTLHVKSYSKGAAGMAMRKEGLLSGAKFPALITYPEEGNLHEFTALESCAIFDVLLPPYSPGDGRHCQYYREQTREVSPTKANMLVLRPDSQEVVFTEPLATVVEEIADPRDFFVEHGPTYHFQLERRGGGGEGEE